VNVQTVPPDARLEALLPGYTFADAYRVAIAADLDAHAAAQLIFDSPPSWVNGLMALRNALVRPLGLKAGERRSATSTAQHVGMFPVLAEAADEILLGLDDRHLDFRLAVTVRPIARGTRQVIVTTVVKTHNRLGRAYLAAILPFHRLLARRMLGRAARRWSRR
jgi:hypothetical protein